jgi:osmotically-inducible protein OsmY
MKKRTILVGVSFALTALISSSLAMPPRKSTSHKQATVSTAKVDDATLAKNVEARLVKTKSLKDIGIHVQASSGVVTLTGTVPKWWQKGVATRETKTVAGVKKIDNQLKIAPGGTRSHKKAAKTAAAKS